jgi:hypothetical protein
MNLIDYPTFIANVNVDDLAMLTSFVVGVPVLNTPGDAAGGDALFAQATRLYTSGLLTKIDRTYSDDGNGNLQQTFIGLVTPGGAGYLAKLARERITLSREVLP